MRVVKIVLSLMFLAFAAWQINDPDPILWIIVYGAMMVVSIMTIFERYPTGIMIVMAAGYLVLSIQYFDGFAEWLGSADRSLLFDDIAKMDHLYIEEAREFMGLLINIVALVLYFFLDWKKHHRHSEG